MASANKNKYSDIAEQVDKLDKKSSKKKNPKSSFFGFRSNNSKKKENKKVPNEPDESKKEKKRIRKEKEEERQKMEEERQKQREAELKEKEKLREQKEKKRQKRIEQKQKDKEGREKERQRLRLEREQEREKALELKRKAKEERIKEKERIRKKREQEALKMKNEEVGRRQIKFRTRPKEDEKQIKETPEISQEKKPIMPKTKFDQSTIEVIKQIDKEIINLQSEKDLAGVIDEVHDGDIIYERTGFGWKGLGSRRIVFDDTLKVYVYEVIEPKLTREDEEMKNKLIHLFRTRADIDVSNIEQQLRQEILQKTLDEIAERHHIKINENSKDKIYYYIYQDFVGYGKIDIPMHDEGIEDISCDGCNIPIFIYHKQFESIRTNIIFRNYDELDSFVIKLSQMCGKQISVYEPVVDGKLADGSRLQTTLGKTITKDSTFTIRRFREDPLTPVDLVANNTMSIDMAAYFWLVIEKGASVLFCGGTASGKTTMLNALSLFLPTSYKIVSVEDTREINLPHENWIAGTTRTGFSSSEASKTGKDIDMFDLIRVALRQRPRAIIVGEVRGKEAYTLFQAMTTGHLSYSTVHASDMRSLIQRLESPPISLPRSLLTSLDMVVFLNSLTIDGRPARRITNVTEIIKLDPETNRLVTVTPYYWVSEIDDSFKDTGGSKILNKIKLENTWDDKRLEKELKNRKKVIQWMIKNKHRSYVHVGAIISEYYNSPKSLLKKIEDSK